MPGRRAGGNRVRVVPGVRDEDVVRVRRIDVDTAYEALRLRRGVDSKEGDRTGRRRVRVGRDEHAAAPRADPEGPLVTRGPLSGDHEGAYGPL